MLHKQAPAIAHLLTAELGLASVKWHQEYDIPLYSTMLYTLRMQE